MTDDVEGVGETVIKEPLTRFTVEGAALWMFARGGKTNWFVRGSAGWMRDAHRETIRWSRTGSSAASAAA